MSNLALIIGIGLLGGMAIGPQAPPASLIGQRLGVLESVFIVHLGGLVAVAVLLLFIGGGRLISSKFESKEHRESASLHSGGRSRSLRSLTGM